MAPLSENSSTHSQDTHNERVRECSQNKASQTQTVMLLLKEIQINGASTFMTLNQ